MSTMQVEPVCNYASCQCQLCKLPVCNWTHTHTVYNWTKQRSRAMTVELQGAAPENLPPSIPILHFNFCICLRFGICISFELHKKVQTPKWWQWSGVEWHQRATWLQRNGVCPSPSLQNLPLLTSVLCKRLPTFVRPSLFLRHRCKTCIASQPIQIWERAWLGVPSAWAFFMLNCAFPPSHVHDLVSQWWRMMFRWIGNELWIVNELVTVIGLWIVNGLWMLIWLWKES